MKIVVGYVKSPEGRAALEWAIGEARRSGAGLVVVHSLRGGGSMASEEEEILTYRPELDSIEKRLDDLGIGHSTRRLIRGMSPADDLIRVAAEEGAELIVIGIRRRSRTGKLIMGSNSQEILLNAECPVVAVKADYLPESD